MENSTVSGREKPAKFLRISGLNTTDRALPRRVYLAASIVIATVLVSKIAVAQIVSVQSPGFPIIEPYQSAASADYSIKNSVLVSVEPFFAANELHSPPNNVVIEPQPFTYAFIPSFDKELAVTNVFGFKSVASGSVWGRIENSDGLVVKAITGSQVDAGISTNDTVLTFKFISQIHVTGAGLPKLDIHFVGKPDYVLKENGVDFGVALGHAEFFMWPGFQPIPAAGTFFNTIYHTYTSVEHDQTIEHVEAADNFQSYFTPGSDWWIAAVAEVRSSAFISHGPSASDLEIERIVVNGDFTRTMKLHIDADPSTPGFAYTTNTGYDYHTGALNLTKVGSPLVHDTAGPFDLDVMIPGAIECRRGTGPSGDGYMIVFDFTNDISGCGSASVGIVTAGPNANQCSVAVNVASGNYVTTQLTGVTDVKGATKNFPASMGVLVGDVNGDGVVNVGDTVMVRNHAGETVDSNNFRCDVNDDGLINVGDTIVVRNASGTSLSPAQIKPSQKVKRAKPRTINN